MLTTPRGLRLHIGFFGRRNVGKSSLLNAITTQSVAIVSDTAGTTTDPVEKPMELLPLGPVVFIDTAGIDDVGALGEERIVKTRQVFERTDVAVVVIDETGWGVFEEELLSVFMRRRVPVVVVANKRDRWQPDADLRTRLAELDVGLVEAVASAGRGATELRAALIACAPEDYITPPTILGDLVPAGGTVVMVVPIDLEAPKGRLILPQVQSLRDCLDHDAMAVVVKERELATCLERLNQAPSLVVCDSQVFLKVAADVPDAVPMTSFSILFARFKGDLPSLAAGATAIDHLRPNDRILVAEACTHHPIGEDIGRVKIPRWLRQYVGGELDFTHVAGKDWPDDLSPYRLVIHCGGCTFNRRLMLSRQERCRDAGIPITNYGCAIAWSLGIFPRALRPFPAALIASGLEEQTDGGTMAWEALGSP